jgi:hypothetical protein
MRESSIKRERIACVTDGKGHKLAVLGHCHALFDFPMLALHRIHRSEAAANAHRLSVSHLEIMQMIGCPYTRVLSLKVNLSPNRLIQDRYESRIGGAL